MWHARCCNLRALLSTEMTMPQANELKQMHKCAAVLPTHTAAEAAIKELGAAGINLQQLSIVGRDYHTDEHVVGFYNTGDRVKHWGKLGAFWGGLFGILFAPAFFWIPGIGPVLTGGIIGSLLMGMIEGGAVGAVAVGGLSALGGALTSIGIPKDSVIAYERALRADKYLIIVHGTEEEVAHARDVLSGHSEVVNVVKAAP